MNPLEKKIPTLIINADHQYIVSYGRDEHLPLRTRVAWMMYWQVNPGDFLNLGIYQLRGAEPQFKMAKGVIRVPATVEQETAVVWQSDVNNEARSKRVLRNLQSKDRTNHSWHRLFESFAVGSAEQKNSSIGLAIYWLAEEGIEWSLREAMKSSNIVNIENGR